MSTEPRATKTEVRINIVRNLHTPNFTGTFYYGNGSDITQIGTTILTVKATDEDANNPFNQGVSWSYLNV